SCSRMYEYTVPPTDASVTPAAARASEVDKTAVVPTPTVVKVDPIPPPNSAPVDDTAVPCAILVNVVVRAASPPATVPTNPAPNAASAARVDPVAATVPAVNVSPPT